MNSRLTSLTLALAFTAGAAFLTGCGEKESVVVVAPPETAPVPAAAPPMEDTPAAPSAPVSEEAALAVFKAEVKGIKEFMEVHQGDSDQGASLANLKELIRRSENVSTAGLPEDLASAYTNMVTVMQGVQSTLNDLPVPGDQLRTYLDEEKAKGGAAAEEALAKLAAFEAAMAIHQKEGEEAAAKLKEVGDKYGIEALELGGN